MSLNTNLAYDLERFEEHSTSENTAQNVRATISVRREKSVHPAKIVTMAVLALVMGFTMLYSQVVVTELNGAINAAETQLSVLEAEKVRMQTELEGKMSLKDIEEKAIGEYGMVKPDGSQVSYVQLQQENQMKAAEKNENFFEKVVNYVKDFVGQ
ncbi:MAG: hypothetical protein ACOX6P_00220 [Candidatus Merdivicinus sp.]|jgi:cell division protein FtsL